MIETHIHILPQIDDGVRDFPDALKLVKNLKEEGYTDIIATPHYWKDYWENSKKIIQEKTAILNKAISELGWDITISPGCEVRLTPELFETIPLENFQTLNNSRYLLVDVFPDIETYHINQLQYLKEKGYIPILAHPERYPYCDSEKNTRELKNLGVLFQLTSCSLLEKDNKTHKRAKELLKNNQYEIIGSDSHNSHNRYFSLMKIKNIIGDTQFELLTQHNCVKILNNKEL